MTSITTDQERARGKHDLLTQAIIGVFFDVYNELGYGFLESIYSTAMQVAITQAGMKVERQVPVPVTFRGERIGLFKADLVIDGAVLVELKACDALIRQHESQTLNYLKATTIEVALLMNFGPTPRFKRLVMNNSLKAMPVSKSLQSMFIGVKSLAQTKVAE